MFRYCTVLTAATLRVPEDQDLPIDSSSTYLLTPWSGVLLGKLTGSQLARNSPHFMEPEGSLPHSQVPSTCPYPEPALSSPYPYISLPEDPS